MSSVNEPNLFSPAIVTLARLNSDLFTDDFLLWLPQNIHIWHAFRDQAIAIHNRGFKHYSARTIIEVLRHHSALRETSGEWKIGNNSVPYLARLFDLAYPDKAGLFSYRETKASEK